jgi:hypothetical protein
MNHEELIEKYFTKSLNANEKSVFDELLLTNETFRKQVLYEEQVQKAVLLNERATLKQKLKSFEAKKSKRNYTIWYAAASIVLLMGIGFWTFFSAATNATLYENYYETYPNVIAPTVRGENKSDLKTEAFYNYDNRNYTKAIALFSELYALEQEDYALFYKSISLMELKRFDEALASFEQLEAKTNNTKFSTYTKWYKALTLLQLEKNQEAIVLLQELANTTNPMQKTAQEVLTELD